MFKTFVVAIAFLFAIGTPVTHAADHDIVKLRNGKKILGFAGFLHEGKLTFVDLDGKEVRLPLGAIDNVVFADHPKPQQERPILAAKQSISGEYRNSDSTAKAPDLPAGTELAYFCWGTSDMKRNSLPFQISQPSIVFLAFLPNGPVPYASVNIDGTDQASLINGSVDNADFGGSEQPFFGAQVLYDCGSGDAYASVFVQHCDWLVAVVNCDSVPTRETIKGAGAKILELAKWRKMELAQ